MSKILITAGSTIVPIDQVRNISNIFKGRTGSEIALYLNSKGHEVTLITSNPDLAINLPSPNDPIEIIEFKTYDELFKAMHHAITNNQYDVIIHSAAVSDYEVRAVCVLDGQKLIPIDNKSKVSSDHKEIFLQLTPTLKIIDLVRCWGFKGYLVKFKLQVGLSDDELITIAQKSRIASGAEMIVANCLEWSKSRAYIITEGKVMEVSREDLAKEINDCLIGEGL